MKLKIAYFGTPDFSAQFLEKILTDKSLPIEVKLVVTQPDRPVGKKQILTSSPVKIIAKKYEIEVYDKRINYSPTYPKKENFSESQLFEQANSDGALGFRGRRRNERSRRDVGMRVDLEEKFSLEDKIKQNRITLSLLFAYGVIIPANLLQIPTLGFWNVHLSLLPQYRGASPVAYSLIMGNQNTGVSLTKMDEKLDHGPIIAQEKTRIFPHEKRPGLTIRLTDLAYELFKQTILKFKIENLKLEENNFQYQDHQSATYTHQLNRTDGFIPFSTLKKALNNEAFSYDELPKLIKEYKQKYEIEKLKLKNENSSKTVFDYFRGSYPWPGIWTLIKINNQEKRLKINDMEFTNGKVILKKVQLEGKKEVDFNQFNNAYKIFNQ